VVLKLRVICPTLSQKKNCHNKKLNMTSSITKGVLSFELSLQKNVSLIVEIQIHLHWGLEWFPSWRLK
jgi:hypothetical protein